MIANTLVCSIALVGAVCAQGAAVIVPSKAASTPGNSVSHVLFGSSGSGTLGNEARTQLFYDTSDIGVGRAVFRSLQLRAPSPGPLGPWPPNLALTLDVTITMSVSPLRRENMSTTWSANHGPGRTTVFSGTVRLPARTVTSWPAPWEAPIVFQTPFAYDGSAGPTLVVEMEVSNNSAQRPWSTELYRTDLGTHRNNHFTQDCRNSANNWSTGVQWNGPAVGRRFTFSYHGYPCQKPVLAASAALFGHQGVGGSFLGRTLPIALDSISGLDAWPNCFLANDVFVTVPLTYMDVATTAPVCSVKLLPAMLIPNDPSLANVVFYTQAVSIDPDASGRPRIFMSSSSEWTIGDAIPVPGSFLERQYDNQNPVGRAMGQEAAVAIRLGT